MSQKKSKTAPIGITMGCPAGIGPEIIIKYFNNISHKSNMLPVVIGDIGVLQETARQLKVSVAVSSWSPGSKPSPDAINVYPESELDIASLIPGRPSPETAAAMASYIETGITLCRDGLLAGIVTCPISKQALHEAGYRFPGHTEMLAERTGASQTAMMMSGSSLRIVLVTIHCALQRVTQLLSSEKLFDILQLTDHSLKYDFGIDSPRIAVAGLNPHSGEEGLFGSEEANIIVPAIKKAREQQIDATGPFPPDTVFYKAVRGTFDVVVCMYHDQGLIPFKLLHFSDGVNITLGLPIVRTSVDHGTAYDIAGKGLADFSSLTAAVDAALFIAENRKTAVAKNQIHS